MPNLRYKIWWFECKIYRFIMYPIGLHIDPKWHYCVGAFAHMQFVCVIDNSKFGQSEFWMIFFHQGLLFCWFKCFD